MVKYTNDEESQMKQWIRRPFGFTKIDQNESRPYKKIVWSKQNSIYTSRIWDTPSTKMKSPDLKVTETNQRPWQKTKLFQKTIHPKRRISYAIILHKYHFLLRWRIRVQNPKLKGRSLRTTRNLGLIYIKKRPRSQIRTRRRGNPKTKKKRQEKSCILGNQEIQTTSNIPVSDGLSRENEKDQNRLDTQSNVSYTKEYLRQKRSWRTHESKLVKGVGGYYQHDIPLITYVIKGKDVVPLDTRSPPEHMFKDPNGPELLLSAQHCAELSINLNTDLRTMKHKDIKFLDTQKKRKP